MKPPKRDSKGAPVDQEIFIKIIEPYYPPSHDGWTFRFMTREELRLEFPDHPEIKVDG